MNDALVNNIRRALPPEFADRVIGGLVDAWDEGYQDGSRRGVEGDDGPVFINPYKNK